MSHHDDRCQRPRSIDGIRRRDLLLNGSSALAAASIASVVPTSIRSAMAQLPSRRPHIVYIVADDLGWKDVGFHGSDIKTPNIDRLAQDGARLEQFYVQPMCTPTRAALMTGRYPCRYGLQTLVIPTPSKYGLPTDERLLPQALKEAGYRTVMVGKWHLGHADRKYWPRQRGFDYHYGSMVGEVDYFTHSSANVRDWYRNDRPVKEQGYVTQLWGADAVAQINAHDPKTPLFLYLAFTAPHSPYQAPKEYIEKYRHIEDPTRRAYAAMITCMDDEIGKVVSALAKKNMRENTLIVFSSDNAAGEIPAMAGGSNGPFRGSFFTPPAEGSMRAPAMVRWPGKVPSGVVTEEALTAHDWYRPFAALAGASDRVPSDRPLDGVDASEFVLGSSKTSGRQEALAGARSSRTRHTASARSSWPAWA